ncbi:reverse transcriptase domain, reverse transcriptase zinc-binding domain protein, partial [Tanacetum coccineum]
MVLWNNGYKMRCSLCNVCMESHAYLFFNFPNSGKIWDLLKLIIHENALPNDWTRLVNCMASRFHNRSIKSILCRILFGAAVYFVWQERNRRLFTSKKRPANNLLESILENIRFRLASIKVIKSVFVDRVANEWNVKFKNVQNPEVQSDRGSKRKAESEIAPTSDPKEAVCFYCNTKGHWKRSCPKYLKDLKDEKGLKKSRRLKHGELNLVTGNRKITLVTRIGKYEGSPKTESSKRVVTQSKVKVESESMRAHLNMGNMKITPVTKERKVRSIMLTTLDTGEVVGGVSHTPAEDPGEGHWTTVKNIL